MSKEQRKKENNNDDIGVNKDWLFSVLEEGIEKPKEWKPREVEAMKPKKAESRLQGYLQDIYEGLVEAEGAKRVKIHDNKGAPEVINLPTEDHFDKWYENNDIGEYTHRYKLIEILNGILRHLGLTTVTGYDEDGFQGILSTLTSAVLDEPGTLNIISDAINVRYPRLVTPPLDIPETEEINEHERQVYETRLRALRERVESNVEQYADVLAELESAAKTDFEQMSNTLNQIVIFGEALWELILYAVMSPRAPRLIINNLDYRSCLHALLAGDISTAKSQVLKICKMIAPKMTIVDDMTKPALEGVFKMGQGIQDGIIDQAQDGAIIVEEFDARFAKMAMFRRIMDCEYIKTYKGGDVKGIHVNTVMLTACNPEADFFQEETYFRSQLGYKEGILSRFDVLIPLTTTTLSNKLIVDKMNLFGDAVDNIDLDDVKKKLSLIASGMDNVKRVSITEDQLEMLRDIFKEKNAVDGSKRLLKNRPFVLLRDLETLARLVNVVAAVNFNSRQIEDGILCVDDDDIKKAITLWENLLHMRLQLYGGRSRILKTPADEIVTYIVQAQGGMKVDVPLLEIYRYIVIDRRMISKATFYREIKKLRNAGTIVQFGERNAKVQVVIK